VLAKVVTRWQSADVKRQIEAWKDGIAKQHLAEQVAEVGNVTLSNAEMQKNISRVLEEKAALEREVARLLSRLSEVQKLKTDLEGALNVVTETQQQQQQEIQILNQVLQDTAKEVARLEMEVEQHESQTIVQERENTELQDSIDQKQQAHGLKVMRAIMMSWLKEDLMRVTGLLVREFNQSKRIRIEQKAKKLKAQKKKAIEDMQNQAEEDRHNDQLKALKRQKLLMMQAEEQKQVECERITKEHNHARGIRELAHIMGRFHALALMRMWNAMVKTHNESALQPGA